MLWDLNDRAIAAGRDALAIAERLGLTELEAHALNNIGVARVHAGDFGGIGDLEHAIDLAAPLNSLELLRAYNNISGALFSAGEPFFKRETEVKALRAAERLGIPRWIANFRAELAVRLLDTGDDWDEAIRLANAVLDEADARFSTTQLARHVRRSICLARGDIEQALEDAYANADAARRTAEDESERWLELMALAHVLLAAGRATEATQIAEEIEIVLNILTCAGPPTIIETLVQLGRREDFLAALTSLPAATPWTDAARHWLAHNFEAAAAIYASIGFRAGEAYARLRAGERLSAKGNSAEASEQLEQALAFYRSVDARKYVSEAEALLRPARAGVVDAPVNETVRTHRSTQ